MNTCIKCETEIHPERIEFLVENKKEFTCVKCTTESRITGFMDYNHKTAPQLVLIPNDRETLRIAKRAFRRAR